MHACNDKTYKVLSIDKLPMSFQPFNHKKASLTSLTVIRQTIEAFITNQSIFRLYNYPFKQYSDFKRDLPILRYINNVYNHIVDRHRTGPVKHWSTCFDQTKKRNVKTFLETESNLVIDNS